MGSLKFHVARTRKYVDKSTALKINSILDMPPGMEFDPAIHHKWRKVTHEPLVAMMLGYAVAGNRGALVAFNHVVDDEFFSLIRRFGNGKKGGKENGEEVEERGANGERRRRNLSRLVLWK